MMNRAAVFISYSRRNDRWLERVLTQLKALQLGEEIWWTDDRIETGEDWEERILSAIDHARVAVLLVSAEFLASEFISKVEVPRIRERSQNGLTIFPIIIEPSPWKEIDWLKRLQIHPEAARALSKLKKPACDTALSEIAKEIKKLVVASKREGSKRREQRLPTHISQAFWCRGTGSFEPASAPSDWSERTLCWLDQLFEGGILLPASDPADNPALSVLFTGPPGSGKSTLALELCYRWSNNAELTPGRSGWSSLYVTTEGTPDRLRSQAQSFGWKDAEHRIFGGHGPGQGSGNAEVTILESTDFENYLDRRLETPVWKTDLIESIGEVIGEDVASPSYSDEPRRLPLLDLLESHVPEILVIDSLNTAPAERRPELFKKFSDLTRRGPKILITILDSGRPGSETPFWEYVSDIVIRLDRDYIEGYMIRTLEIRKARYQSHTWGVQQLKIYPRSRLEPMPAAVGEGLEDRARRERRRAHPYRVEGGIFLFPSIHLYLSKYKRRTPVEGPEPVSTGLVEFDNMLKGESEAYRGLPRGRCTGFIGIRGGHKSHLGYVFVLSAVLERGEKALVVSLRDDEGMAKKTMGGILRDEFRKERPEEHLKSLIREDRFEVLYYPPGYITPEEFFHRIFVSIQRMKNGYGGNVNLLFNSLDQLPSRFPLCAREKIFVPGIIEMLLGEKVTSVFIGVKEPGQPGEQYGLLSMADLLVEFDQLPMSRAEYGRYVVEGRHKDPASFLKMMPERREMVVAKVIRFAGGQEAGAACVLELVARDSPRAQLYGGAGLQCAKLPVGYRFEIQRDG